MISWTCSTIWTTTTISSCAGGSCRQTPAAVRAQPYSPDAAECIHSSWPWCYCYRCYYCWHRWYWYWCCFRRRGDGDVRPVTVPNSEGCMRLWERQWYLLPIWTMAERSLIHSIHLHRGRWDRPGGSSWLWCWRLRCWAVGSSMGTGDWGERRISS